VAATNAAGATALHRAARWGHTGVAAVLLRAGANTAAVDRGGLAPPDWADAKGFFSLAAGLRSGKLAAPAPLAGAGADAGEGGGGGGGGVTPTLPRAALPPSVPQPGALLTVEGWMAKQGHFFPNWKNRWFLLEGRKLSYFTKQGAKTPQGVISLVRGTDLVVEERYSKPFCFTVVTRTKKFILQAANEEEMTEWIESIQNNIMHAPGGASGWGPCVLAQSPTNVLTHTHTNTTHTLATRPRPPPHQQVERKKQYPPLATRRTSKYLIIDLISLAR